MPTVTEIAKNLVDLCRQGKNMEVVDKYYSNEITSIESSGSPGMPAEMKGLEAIHQKHKWWNENHEVHSAEVNGPFVGENQFAVEFKFDATLKASGQRIQMSEMGLYTVQGGKIVREHFYYNAGA